MQATSSSSNPVKTTAAASAYARLVGRIGNNNDGNNVKEYTALITSIPATLGRGEESIIVDTEDTTISRKHVLLGIYI